MNLSLSGLSKRKMLTLQSFPAENFPFVQVRSEWLLLGRSERQGEHSSSCVLVSD